MQIFITFGNVQCPVELLNRITMRCFVEIKKESFCIFKRYFLYCWAWSSLNVMLLQSFPMLQFIWVYWFGIWECLCWNIHWCCGKIKVVFRAHFSFSMCESPNPILPPPPPICLLITLFKLYVFPVCWSLLIEQNNVQSVAAFKRYGCVGVMARKFMAII